MIRIFTSLNWVFGTLAIVAAVLYPTLHEKFYLVAIRAVVETNVKKIAIVEAAQYQTRERYLYFSSEPRKFEAAMKSLEVGIEAGEFDIQAYSSENDALVIRAITSLDTMKSGWSPPMMYEYKINRHGDEGSGKWATFSDATPGLGVIF
jgi:hypothetical protein